MISATSIEALKARIDIIDIVGSYVELKKAGANYKAPCPFHDEKSASFVVSPQKQKYHCFGCGVDGNGIDFVMEYKKLTFAEAVEDIANDLNFTLQYDNSGEAKKDYKKLMEFMNRHYQSHRDNAVAYLLDRGISAESIETFEIGYAHNSSSQLTALNASHFLTAEAIECGILALDDQGKSYARLTERITFPIRNRSGKLIGFGGRILSGDRAKYINSPQTVLFDKSSQLYGYHLAAKAINDKGTITIVEGYLDVVMFHQAGIKTATATMGTALTEAHAKLIKKQNLRVLLCYDGDRAGIAAAFKAAKLLSAHSIYGGVVLFPEGKDPADMVKSGNTAELFDLMKSPTPLIKFAIRHIAASYDIEIPNQKHEALIEIETYMKTLPPLIQDEYKNFIANTLRINPVHVSSAQHAPHIPEAKLPSINLCELNIIKTARENEGAFNYLVDIADTSFFPTHYAEYEMLLRGDDVLDGLLLRDEITIYAHDEFINQVKILLIDGYRRQLNNVQSSGLDFNTKRQSINELNDKINRLHNDVRSA